MVKDTAARIRDLKVNPSQPLTSDARNRLIKIVEQEFSSMQQRLRNKIISRLCLASTHGEATVIMREVLGNDIIPTLDVKQLGYDKK